MEERTATQDDRVMAALAHAAVLVPMWGTIGTIVIWATQREKSDYVRFQALQALVYQLLPILGFGVFFLCYMLSMVLSFFSTMALPISFGFLEGIEGEGGIIAFLFSFLVSLLGFGVPFLVFGVGILIWFGYVIYAIYGAIRNLQGEPFRYAVLGPWLERQLNT